MPGPGDVVPYPPYPVAGAAGQGALQYSLESTQLLVKAALELILSKLPVALAADEGLKVHIQNSLTAVISGAVAVSNMIPAVETGLSKEATLIQVLNNMGLTTNDATFGTVIGRLAKLVSLLPAALAPDDALKAAIQNQLLTRAFDRIEFAYNANDDVTGMTFKQSGNVVMTLTFTLGGADGDRVDAIART